MKMHSALGVSSFLLLGALIACSPTARAYTATELVVNGSFEARPLGTGWKDLNNTIMANSVSEAEDVRTGHTWARLGWYGSTEKISQNLFIPATANTVTFSYQKKDYSLEHRVGYDEVSVTVYDAESGVGYYSLTYDPAAKSLTSAWKTFTADLSAARGHNVTIQFAVRNFGDSDITTVQIDDVSLRYTANDVTAPTTSLSISSTISADTEGAYSLAPALYLTATDDAGGSGVRATYYYWDSGAVTPYSLPLKALEGTHVLHYYSSDVVGNTEVAKSATIKVKPPNPKVTVITVTTSKGASVFKINSKVTVTPFAKTYRGKIWSQKVDLGSGNIVYLFANTGSFNQGLIKVYNSSGKLLGQYKPFDNTFATRGLVPAVVFNADRSVYLAVGAPNKHQVRVYRVGATGLTSVQTLSAFAKNGTPIVKAQKLSSTAYGFTTYLTGQRSTIKVWKYDTAKKKFVEDTKFKKSTIKI